MGREKRVLTVPGEPGARSLGLLSALRRRKPRSYLEWKTLRSWGKLPSWEEDPPGYLLRELREGAELTQLQLAERLGCSQQAVAQAERWQANPTARLMADWARGAGEELVFRFGPS